MHIFGSKSLKSQIMPNLGLLQLWNYAWFWILRYCVCVLTSIQTGQYYQIIMWWSSKPQSGIAAALEFVTFYVLIP